MAQNDNLKIDKGPVGSSARWWSFLVNPHPIVQETGEKTRAQLLALLTLILTIVYLWAIFSRPDSYNEFIVLLLFTIVSYVLSRTPYYQIGTYFFCFSFTAFAYITLFLGTASSYSSAITTSVHVSLVVASLLLSTRGLFVMVLFLSVASFAAPYYSQTPILVDSDFYKDTGVAISIGLLLTGATTFRSFVERKRLEELGQVNRELEDLTTNLEAEGCYGAF
jgi:hypothetical protein